MDRPAEQDLPFDLATAVWMPLLASTYSDLTHADAASGLILDVQSKLHEHAGHRLDDSDKAQIRANLEDVLSALGDARGEIIRLAQLCVMGGYTDDQIRNLGEYDVQAWATAEEVGND